ncbi:MAG: acetate kinase [Natronospirillum sp.]|uniref:acetate/propionate family kinase n=1 Tax=Natronospirillum sp. TaxID=2812955 RepID=UPI0026000C98|nr:acetate kinase [Natronospirillum sp.]MCH8551431.1 acetate kinase [Natronospirillum sp.]
MTASMILVLNSGSSSLKFSIFNSADQTEPVSGLAENLGQPDARLTVRSADGKTSRELPGADHQVALEALVAALSERGFSPEHWLAAGHRVVHGAESFSASVRVTEDIVQRIDDISHLAPLHNPANLEGIRALSRLLPDLPQVAVFDTAFHQTIPAAAYTYALPYHLYEDHGIRRYGFHGTSHRYVSSEAVRLLQLEPDHHRVITAHLGNGCSACAVKNGQSLDTTMGMTPLEGLVMGTRSGDVDPSIHLFLHERTGMNLAEITGLLNRESGLLGISGLSNDMRTLLAAAEDGHARAELAIEVFCYRLARGISSLLVATGGLDALVFTGGIGENAAGVRERTVYHLGWLGLNLDVTANLNHGRYQQGIISTTQEPAVLVIPTREEWMIAQDTQALVANAR